MITRSMRFRIRAAPAQRQTHIDFSARVKLQQVQADEDDRLRITSLYHTSVVKSAPIYFAMPHPVSQEEQVTLPTTRLVEPYDIMSQ
ncbi:hypothetical protein EDB19DRAFT_1197885 [Suillus lakei]|nr:hypothetical protein EDB19DRAFT_1197885 [Suillus lakei]